MKKLLFLFILIAIPAMSQTIPFQSRPDDLIILTMNVEGKPMRVLLDTGAQSNVFRAKLGPQGEIIKMESASQTTLVHRCAVAVENITVGAVCGVNLPEGQDALLGEGFLSQFKSVTINYKEHTVTFVQ
jgi:hypothetical protein